MQLVHAQFESQLAHGDEQEQFLTQELPFQLYPELQLEQVHEDTPEGYDEQFPIEQE